MPSSQHSDEYHCISRRLEDIEDPGAPEFPKYVSPLISLAAQISQSTDPDTLGPRKELFEEYCAAAEGAGETPSIGGWRAFHRERCPDAVEKSVGKTMDALRRLAEAIDKIEEEDVMSLLTSEDPAARDEGLHLIGSILSEDVTLGDV